MAESLGLWRTASSRAANLDAVKLTVHSCPTLAGAYWMPLLGLLTVLLISYLVLVEGGNNGFTNVW